MPHLERDGVRLFYEERGSGAPTVVLLHGWTCDHRFMKPLAEHFAPTHRVIALDLRGHGASDAPVQEYTLPGFADDVAWVCARLGVMQPVVIGHSMGGAVALVLAAEHADVPAAIVSLDSALVPLPAVQALVDELTAALRGPVARAAQRRFIEANMFHPADDPDRRRWIVETMVSAPQHVMVSAFANLFGTDHGAWVAACQVPWLALYASTQHSDVARLAALCPHLVAGQTVGAGHFHQLEVPEQVCPMIEKFLAITNCDPAGTAGPTHARRETK